MGTPRVKQPKARRMLWCPQHPLATAHGYALEYRVLLYDRIGPGLHPCYWCQRLVHWTVRHGSGTSRNGLTVDHIDNNPHNNDDANLVPACQACNGVRSRAVHDDELFITRRNGTRLRAESRICAVCHNPFLTYASDRRNNHGLTCSRSCARRLPRRSNVP